MCCAIGISRKLIQSLLVRTVTLYEATSEDEQDKAEADGTGKFVNPFNGQEDGGNPLADDDLPSASKPKPTAETFNAPSAPSTNLQRNTVVYVPIVRQT